MYSVSHPIRSNKDVLVAVAFNFIINYLIDKEFFIHCMSVCIWLNVDCISTIFILCWNSSNLFTLLFMVAQLIHNQNIKTIIAIIVAGAVKYSFRFCICVSSLEVKYVNYRLVVCGINLLAFCTHSFTTHKAVITSVSSKSAVHTVSSVGTPLATLLGLGTARVHSSSSFHQ